jgi:hypothetical protein
LISVELKGVDFQSAFEQLAETRIHRLEYQNIKTLFREQGTGTGFAPGILVSQMNTNEAQTARLRFSSTNHEY